MFLCLPKLEGRVGNFFKISFLRLDLDLLRWHMTGSFNEPGELRIVQDDEHFCFPQGVVASHKLLR
jgi:hypothetical protein